MTSIPVQEMIMKLRSIACWERPMETATYAVLYLLLCIFTKVISTIVSSRALLERSTSRVSSPSLITDITSDSVRGTFNPESLVLSAYDPRSSRQARTFGEHRDASARPLRAHRTAWCAWLGRRLHTKSWTHTTASIGGFGRLDGSTDKVCSPLALISNFPLH